MMWDLHEVWGLMMECAGSLVEKGCWVIDESGSTGLFLE